MMIKIGRYPCFVLIINASDAGIARSVSFAPRFPAASRQSLLAEILTKVLRHLITASHIQAITVFASNLYRANAIRLKVFREPDGDSTLKAKDVIR
ncbi:MAG: hypothetical protein H7144_11115 [Burkholderiales bacterium]|nr:hypothetical protein [Phycisphaerae bacterium]